MKDESGNTIPEVIPVDNTAALRKAVYALLILSSVGSMTGRILTVNSSLGETPLLSANDRSRWCTVRALVDHGTYAIDDVVVTTNIDGRTVRDREWHPIDKVVHRDSEGRLRQYSSKPPLFPTIVAGLYYGLQKSTGLRIAERPYYVIRTLLILVNVLPLALMLYLLSKLVERFGRTDWGRVFVMAAACHGTFLTTFAVTLNNHIPAAVAALVAIYAAVRIWCDGDRRLWLFALTGAAAAFTVVNELPALSLLGWLGLALLMKAPKQTLIAGVPAVLLVATGFFGTNYAAHQSLRPPYAHRSDGEVVARLERSELRLSEGEISSAWISALGSVEVELPNQAEFERRSDGVTWALVDASDGGRNYAIVPLDNAYEIRRWDHWYDYPDSYWQPDRKQGVDRGEASRATYALHVLIGHHGILSLTPIWLLSLVGLAVMLFGSHRKPGQRELAITVIVLTLVCLAFYLARPLADRNYGGVCCGLRWMFWFIPLWSIALVPGCDVFARGQRRQAFALAALGVSIISAYYASLNPWNHPWIFRYWEYLGWVRY